MLIIVIVVFEFCKCDVFVVVFVLESCFFDCFVCDGFVDCVVRFC